MKLHSNVYYVFQFQITRTRPPPLLFLFHSYEYTFNRKDVNCIMTKFSCDRCYLRPSFFIDAIFALKASRALKKVLLIQLEAFQMVVIHVKIWALSLCLKTRVTLMQPHPIAIQRFTVVTRHCFSPRTFHERALGIGIVHRKIWCPPFLSADLEWPHRCPIAIKLFLPSNAVATSYLVLVQ